MNIITLPNPILSQKSSDVDVNNLTSLVKISRDMLDLMYETQGCGLAAPQVGINQKIVVIDCDYADDDKGNIKNPIVMFNPVITFKSDEVSTDYEGCLSVPGIKIAETRAERITVKYTNENGKETELEADGLLARCVQHECDHLDGITIIDRLSGMSKMSAIAKYNAALKQGAVPGKGKVFYTVG